MAATSCSVKNGFPSARAYSSSTTGADAGEPASSATCSATSSRDSGPSRTSATPPRPRTCVSHSATCGSSGVSSDRHVTTTVTAESRRGPGQKRQAVQGRGVRPMHVLHDQDDAASPGHRAQQLRDRGEQPVTLPALPGRSTPPPRTRAAAATAPPRPGHSAGVTASAASSSSPPSTRLSSPNASATGSSGSVSRIGRHPPQTDTTPSAATRRMPSVTNRVLPTPASPMTRSSRASPPTLPQAGQLAVAADEAHRPGHPPSPPAQPRPPSTRSVCMS